jgi:hypothetical protein
MIEAPALTWLHTASNGFGLGRWGRAVGLASFVFRRTADTFFRNHFIVVSLVTEQPTGLVGFFTGYRSLPSYPPIRRSSKV